MPFNELFGGQVLLPADLTYLSLTISASVELVWPLEQQVGGSLVVADIIDLNASNPGLNVDMPDARLVSQGTSVLFNNVGGQTVTIRDQAGATIISLASGTAWLIYLRDNTTEAGLWRTFQFGASVSVANAAALAGAGLKAIGATLNTRVPVSTKAVNYTIVDADRAVALVWTSGVGQFDLPAAGTVGSDWYVIVRNSGSGDLTVVPPAGTIDGAASATFPAGSSAFVVCDGANYFTVGFGTGSGGGGSGFDFVTINVAGSGDYTLSGAELSRIGYRFTGVLTGTRNIIVPGSTEEYWVDNQTTGAFSLFVKTVAQVPGIEILQNNRNILYCDGSNVIAAESATVSFPIPVAQGGTGAVTAAAARTNLGSGAAGDAVFVSTTQSAARTALGSGAVGDAIFITGTQAAAQTALGMGLALSNTFTQSGTAAPAISLSAAIPVQQWNETDAAVDNRRWLIYPEGEAFNFSVVNDANTIETTWLTVNRTSTVIDTINFPNGTLQYGGVEVGYRDLPVISTAGNRTFLNTDRGRIIEYGGAGGHTLTVPAAGVIADGGIITVANSGTGGCSVAVTAGNLVWFNGSGALSTGTRTLAVGAWVTLRVFASGSTYITGTGIS